MKQLIAALAATLALLAVALPSWAQTDAGPRRIVVNGEGSTSLPPDMAIINLTVTREAATAREALSANSEAMASVIAAMKGFGIAGRDLQTSGFGINPRYTYPRNNNQGEARKLVGYTVRNSLSVRVRDIEKAGEVLDKSVTLGVNEGGGIVFTNDDPSAALKEARVAAVAAATEKARTLAQAAGVKLGPVREVSEQAFNPRPVPMMHAEMRMQASDGAVPIAQGENSYRVTVHMTFDIDG